MEKKVVRINNKMTVSTKAKKKRGKVNTETTTMETIKISKAEKATARRKMMNSEETELYFRVYKCSLSFTLDRSCSSVKVLSS